MSPSPGVTNSVTKLRPTVSAPIRSIFTASLNVGELAVPEGGGGFVLRVSSAIPTFDTLLGESYNQTARLFRTMVIPATFSTMIHALTTGTSTRRPEELVSRNFPTAMWNR